MTTAPNAATAIPSSAIPTTGPAAAPPPIQLREVVMSLATPKAPAKARVIRTEICTASRKAAGCVRHIEFDLTGTPLVGKCVPGQAFGILCPGCDEAGKPHKPRLYSISSPSMGEDGEGRILSTTVKRVIDEHWDNHKLFKGVASNFLCDLNEGDEVLISGPNGKRFILPAKPEEHDYMFFSTGTGIAPFRGMIIDLLERWKTPSKVYLLMGAPYATDLLYHDYFLKLQEAHPNFRYITAISRERQEDGHDRMYLDARLTTNRDELIPVLESERTLCYICGIAGMEIGIFRQMATHLTGSYLEQYLQIQPQAMASIQGWGKAMLGKEIKCSHRLFMEVYS